MEPVVESDMTDREAAEPGRVISRSFCRATGDGWEVALYAGRVRSAGGRSFEAKLGEWSSGTVNF